MTIFQNSRYANQSVLRLRFSDGVVYPTVFRGTPPTASSFLHYEVKVGDRFDLLAYAYFEDSTLWWLIADANPEVFYPDDLVPGSIIRIPRAV